MRKLFLIMLAFFLPVVNSAAQVNAIVNCPDSWGPGRYSKVSVEIDFGKSAGLARFAQDYPVGFELVPAQIPDGGDFSWADNQLNVVWIKIPPSNKTSFSFYAKPDQTMSGQFELQGRLICISKAAVRTVSETKTTQVMIGGTGGILPAELKEKEPGMIVTNVTIRSDDQKIKAEGNIEFRVQVTTSGSNNPDEIMKRLKLDPKDGIKVVKSGQIYKYQVGSFRDYQAARNMLRKLIDNGISDAFIVAYQGEDQISVDQARGSGK